MIDFYFSNTPNGRKVRLFMEESQLPHRVVPVSISKRENFKPEFLAISPNNKIPAIVDHAPADGGGPLPIFESGAILIYLADKIGRFIPMDMRGRVEVLKWLFWQVGGLGPMGGQIEHFNLYAKERVPYALERYQKETRRLFGVLDRRLGESQYVAGSEYSIADIACHPWIAPYRDLLQDLDEFKNLKRWYETILAHPAAQRVYEGVHH
jgi:GST-like protein